MKILSFDIGIVNLAFCVLDYQKKIHKWENISLCNKSEIENTIDLITKLDQRPEILDVDLVLLEYQPRMNPKMRVMSESVRSYLIFRGIIDKKKKFKLKNYSAKHKLKCYQGDLPSEITITPEMLADKTKSGLSKLYRIRKKQAIYQCEMLIDEEYKDFFTKSKKKDDLADSYLQALSYIMFKQETLPKPPTRKQMKYKKFSKNNLRYLLQQFQNESTQNESTQNESTQNESTQNAEDNVRESIVLKWLEDKYISKNVKRLYGENYCLKDVMDELLK